nr:reverse transcriptase domain-containing protein [Tanacetum cinerariifolium]
MRLEESKPSHHENSVRTVVFTKLGEKERNIFTRLSSRESNVFSRLGPRDLPHREQRLDPKSHRAPTATSEATISKSKDSEGGHWKSKSKKQNYSTYEDDLSQPWLCEETDPFTLRIRNFVFPKRVRMSGNVKTYDGLGDPKDHMKNFQSAAKVERWVLPTWCHMFSSTLMGATKLWFNELPPESIDSFMKL